MTKEYLDKSGLTYLWSKLKTKFSSATNWENGSGFDVVTSGRATTEDMTSQEVEDIVEDVIGGLTSDSKFAAISSSELYELEEALGITHAQASRLYNILNALAQRGQYYRGAWTATSAAANNAPVTEGITLPKGVYVITLKVPVYTNDSARYVFGIGTPSDGALDWASSQFVTQSACSWVVELTSEKTLYGITQQSAQISLDQNYLGRGHIKAVRIK